MSRSSAKLSSNWRCPSCIHRSSINRKTFSTTPSRQKYGPESPKYIDIPEPPQKTYPPRPHVKGTLPVPRDVFKHRVGGHLAPDLTTQATATVPYAGRGRTDAEKSRNEWKQKMTDSRKANFREGLTELAKRKQTGLAADAARFRQKQAERARILAMPEPEDERLTNPTIAMVLKTQPRGFIPDPNREERVAAMKANVAAHEARRVGDRQDALHTLYMHAKDFITTETQLDAEIENAFGTPEAPKRFASGNSMWSKGMPESIQDKLNKANRSRNVLGDRNWVDALLNERTKTIAEKLTGGKI